MDEQIARVAVWVGWDRLHYPHPRPAAPTNLIRG
jgi:hypothetical protein